MPKPRKKESVQSVYFRWLVWPRDSTWYADGRSNPIKLGRYSLAASTRDEALENLKRLDLVKAVEHGLADRSLLENRDQSVLTLDDGWKLYFDSIAGRKVLEGISTNTPKRYRAVRDKFSAFCKMQGVTHCEQITKNLLMAYAAWLDGEGYAYATEYLEITTLKQLVKFLVEENRLPATALIRLPLKKPDDTDTYCYHPNEVAAIVDRCRNVEAVRWLHPVVMALVYTGMRISELASLRWTDIDVARNLIILTDERHSAARRKTGNVRELKGKRSRSFPIHEQLKPVLLRMPRFKDGLLFHGPLGGRLKPDTVRRCLVRDVLMPLANDYPTPPGAATGFVDGRLHSFRHYFCSICADSGVPEQTLMKWLGHRSSRMVKRYYHLHDDASQQAMQKVEFVRRVAGKRTTKRNGRGGTAGGRRVRS